MKKTLAVTLVLLIVVYAGLAFVGIDPKDRRPGTRLSGATTPLPDDWSFTADYAEVALETRPWYGIPFSVTVVVGESGGRLFVPSLYETEAEFPGTKYWNKVVARNPNVRLRVGERLFELAVHPIRDEAQFQFAQAALAAKYPSWGDRTDTARPRKYALLELKPRAR